MCPTDEMFIDYSNLTPEQWQRARQQILSRAQAARAQALRDLASSVVHLLRAALGSGAAVAKAVIAKASKWLRAYALWRERKAAARELHALDDRTLKDMGVSRSEIEWVVRGPHATRLRDATIAANPRQRCATAGSSVSAKPRQRTEHIKKRAA
jgi:uncharacterized protein YjiS (DUF1127 family)